MDDVEIGPVSHCENTLFAYYNVVSDHDVSAILAVQTFQKGYGRVGELSRKLAVALRRGTAVGKQNRPKQKRALTGEPNMKAFHRSEALSVLSAMSVSPSFRDRWYPLLAVVGPLHRSGSNRNSGQPNIDSRLLQQAVKLVPSAMTGFGDPSLDVSIAVQVRWANQLFRIAPGAWERPISVVEHARAMCRLIDGWVDSNYGFRLSDLVDVALAHMDDVVRRFDMVWAGSPHFDDSGVPVLSAAEVSAVSAALPLRDLASRRSRPDAAARALQWASMSRDKINAVTGLSDPVFGAKLCVRSGDDLVPLPLGFILDGVFAAVAQLTVAYVQSQGADRLRSYWTNRVLSLLSAWQSPLRPDPDAGSGPIVALQKIRDDLLLAVDLCVPEAGDTVENTVLRLSAFVPGASLQTASGEFDIPASARIVRLAVVASVGGLSVFYAADDDDCVEVMTVEDLRWIVATGERRDDLAMFLLEPATPISEQFFSFGMFDRWEAWRNNHHGYHRMGKTPSMLMIAPHSEVAEWEYHARLVWLQESLLSAGLKGLAEWPYVDVDRDTHSATLIDAPQDTVVSLALRDDGVTVAIRHSFEGDGDIPEWNVANGIRWKLRHMSQPGLSPLVDRKSSVRITVERCKGCDSPRGVDVARTSAGVVLIRYDAGFEELLGDSDANAEILLGSALSEACDSSPASSEFLAGWQAVPPGIAVDTHQPVQRARHLKGWSRPHPAIYSECKRTLSQWFRDSGLSPIILEGREAARFESSLVFPKLREFLRKSLHRFDRDAVLRRLGEELESVSLDRMMLEGEQARSRHLNAANGVSDVGYTDERFVASAAVRIVSLCMEEELAADDRSGLNPGDVDVQIAFGWATLMFESGNRSEFVDANLATGTIEITDSFELLRRGDVSHTDLARFSRAVTEENAPERSRTHPSFAPDRKVPERGRLPKAFGVERLDEAFYQTHGFGIQAIVDVLNAIRSVDVSNSAPIRFCSAGDLEQEVLDATEDGRAFRDNEVIKAIDWLTLRRENLQAEPREHWETDRRKFRLASRPIIEVRVGELALCPWHCELTLKILAVHLSDGRLPWPREAVSSQVSAALHTFRQSRNKELEREAAEAIQQIEALSYKASVKKHKVLGMSEPLIGEIDLLVIDKKRSRIWVLEVKDRAVAFSPSQQRRAIGDFHSLGGYTSVLQSKTAQIQRYAREVAKALGCEDDQRVWQVFGAFITRRLEPAGFSNEPVVPFRLVSEVATMIEDELPPIHGYIRN
jgi:hypothetical protein